MLDVRRDGGCVNRADFIPDTVWVRRADGWMVPLHRADDPEAWLDLVNSDDSIVTQADDGERDDGRGVFPTSSSTAPSIMKRMLDLLDVHAGMDVLEIGAGTGCNAALLAERAAPGRVTTIEVDPAIAEHARRALRATGHTTVTVVTGDGTLGHPDHAPYDRVIATAGAVEVPYTWVEQTRPTGTIALPLDGSFERQAFLRLTVFDDGTARGRFHGAAGFMRLRSQRNGRALWWDDADGIQVTTTRLYPREPFTEFEAGFVLGLRCPGWVRGRRVEKDGTEVLRLSHSASGSWASFTSGSSGAEEHEVCQYGPRRLWDELEAAYRWWTGAGRPHHTRFGMTVTPDGQAFWLDTPDQVVSPPMTSE
jgi:protein-L-isoaspartate O-methyltransferase